MEKIELVIKIPLEEYRLILLSDRTAMANCASKECMMYAIKNGTPLPKGHGDLMDRNELKKVYDERITYLYTLNRKDNPSREAKICATNWCSNTIDELPTIIEADNAESEGK